MWWLYRVDLRVILGCDCELLTSLFSKSVTLMGESIRLVQSKSCEAAPLPSPYGFYAGPTLTVKQDYQLASNQLIPLRIPNRTSDLRTHVPPDHTLEVIDLTCT